MKYISACPIRIIPFDLGRTIYEEDFETITKAISSNYSIIEKSTREKSILKDCLLIFSISENVKGFIFKKGILVVVLTEPKIDFTDNYQFFSIDYCESRKKAHNQLFNWEHDTSTSIKKAITLLWSTIRDNQSKEKLRESAKESFENKGLSYVMTLSMFDISEDICETMSFNEYPNWLKNNIYALLDPSVLFLEDTHKFEPSGDHIIDTKNILDSIKFEEEPKDYEKHRNLDTYMSWAAVVTVGQIQETDIEEYTALEVQLQSDWFYLYCLDKTLKKDGKLNKKEIISYQQMSYDIELLENRLYDFDDSSMPARVLEIQKGLVITSGLQDNIQHFQRKIKFILEREKLNTDLRQKRLGQSSEILLFIIAFIEIAPIVSEYGNKIFSHAGIVANCMIFLLGFILLLRKE